MDAAQNLMIAKDDSMNSDLDARIRTMEDREAVRTLLADYCLNVTKADWAGVVDLFVEEGVLDIRHPAGGGTHWVGREEILQNLIAKNLPVIPLIHNEVITVNGDSAESRCTMLTPRGADASSNGFVGNYRDQIVRQDGRWRFKARHFEPLLGTY
jgi:hypothetical protein